MSAHCPHCGAVAGYGHEIGHKSDCPSLRPLRKLHFTNEWLRSAGVQAKGWAMTPAARIAADLSTIVGEAEKHGTLPRLKSVAIYFDEVELRTIIHALRMVTDKESAFDRIPGQEH